MKKIVLILAIMMAATLTTEAHRHYFRPSTITLQTFYDELTPYGEWINTPEYGYVWRPYINPEDNFRPYATRGNWAYTGLGWTWVSDYPWGWATFHYGRWYFDDYLGWAWIPGYEWAPAWVAWGSYDNCWAWAPMGPGVLITAGFDWRPPDFWWICVPHNHFCSDRWYDYRYDRPVIVNNIVQINNVYYGDNRNERHRSWFHGPRVRDVERHTNARIRRMDVEDADNPRNLSSHDNKIRVYRPEVTAKRSDDRPHNFVERQKAENRSNIRTNESRTAPAPERRDPPARVEPQRQPSREATHPANQVTPPSRSGAPAGNPDRVRRDNEHQPSGVEPAKRTQEPTVRKENRENKQEGRSVKTERTRVKPAKTEEKKSGQPANTSPTNRGGKRR